MPDQFIPLPVIPPEQIIIAERDLALALMHEPDLQEALRLAFQAALKVSGMDCGGIYLRDCHTGDLTLAFHHGLSAEFVEEVSSFSGHEDSAHLVADGWPQYVFYPEFKTKLSVIRHDEGIRGLAVIPLRYEDEVIGCVNIASHEYDIIPEVTRQALETVAAHIGAIIVHLQNKDALQQAHDRLEREVARRTGELTRANEQLREEIERREVVEQRLADMAAFKSVRASIHTVALDEEEDVLWEVFITGLVEQFGYCMAWYGSYENGCIKPEMHAGRVDHYLDDLVLEIGAHDSPDAQCAMNLAIMRGRAFGYADLAHDEGFARWRDYALELGYGANLALPVIVSRQVEGGVMVYASAAHAFNDERVEHLGLLVNEMSELLGRRRRQRKMEQALKESEEKYRSLVESAGEAIFSVDRRGDFLFMNSNAAAQMGGKPGDFVGRNMRELFPRDIADKQMATIEEVITGGRGIITENPTVICNQEKWFRTSVQPVRNQHTGETYALLIARDITDRRNLQEQLIRSERMAAVGTLAGGVAHEFNNINVAILGYTQMALERDDLDAELRDWLGRVSRASLRARNIAQNLLTFARPREAPVESANVVPVIRETVNLVRSQFEKTGVTIILDLKDVPDTMMHAPQIGQVLLNLLINAMHAMLGCDRRELKVSCWARRKEILIRVADSGVGIPKPDLPKIFTPFFSTKGEYAGDTPQAAIRGTGLGLSISHTIMENHGGRITVTSRINEGTSFTLHLPVKGMAGKTESAVEEHAAQAGAGSGRVLVLDDEPDTLDLVRLVLGRAGYTVVTSDNPVQALEMLNSEDFDVVLTDLQMPALHGLKFLQDLRSVPRGRQPQCIALTGHPVILKDMDKESIFAVLLKPFDIDELKRLVAAAMDELYNNE